MSDDTSAVLSFEQHHLPGLESGEYLVTVEQTLEMQEAQAGSGEKQKKTVTPVAKAFFTIAGNRFRPLGAELVQVYPPDKAVGEYERTFAHVVLANPSFPWTREPVTPPLKAPGPADNDHDADVAAWLAVLLLDEDDGVALQPAAKQVNDLFEQREGERRVYSYFEHSKRTASAGDAAAVRKEREEELDVGERLDDPCLVLDIPRDKFWAIAPSLNDLRMLAHVRLTSTAAKPLPALARNATQADIEAGSAAYAIVVGSRMPRTARQTRAYLVSLEGLGDLLPKDDGSAPENTGLEPDAVVRLACLATWAFTSTGSGRHFEALLGAPDTPEQNRLAADPTGAGAHDYALRRPQPTTGTGSPGYGVASAALRMGYVPLLHHTRDGGDTVSWYRGPLTPYRVGGFSPSTYASADAAARYDPDTGLFDMSYAAAWQLGRLMGLQAKSFSVALHNWRRSDARKVAARLQSHALSQSAAQAHAMSPELGAIGSLLTAFLRAPEGAASAAVPLLHEGHAAAAQAHREAFADAQAVGEATDVDAVPESIASWLGALQLLNGIPFHYLVPDEQMLPRESLRFFCVDAQWMNALSDGACSIGRGGKFEAAHHEAMQVKLREATAQAAAQQRAAALGLPAPATGPGEALPALTGFLLRSDAVKFWPNLQANGYGPKPDAPALDLLRFEHLAEDVVIGLFAGETLQRLDLHEPAEGVHFGLSDATETNRAFTIDLRSSTAGAGAIGSVLRDGSDKARTVQAPMRGTDVLRAWDMGVAIKAAQLGKDGAGAVPSSEFGMQMIKGVARVQWEIAP